MTVIPLSKIIDMGNSNNFNWNNAFNLALNMAKSKLDERDQFWVEDIAQNAVIKAFLQMDKFDDSRGNFSSWMLTITKNLCFDFTKRKEKRVIYRGEELEFPLTDDDEIEGKIELEKRILHLEKGMNELNERDRKIVSMKYFNNATSREISNETKIAESNVPMYAKRANLKLHEKMMKFSA